MADRSLQSMIPDLDIQRLPVDSEERTFNDWTVSYTKSHILHSQCSMEVQCKDNQPDICRFCFFTNTLQLPHLPEMVFPNNVLRLIHCNGLEIEFNALEALKLVSNGKLNLKVSCSDEWQESRDSLHLEEKIKPFDWTFSTDYKGTCKESTIFTVTDERIDIERLKERERILFYQELMLFEDELHDNGIATCTVKIRVMPSAFFILLRYFLRVDGVIARVNDTRYFHDFATNYILREFTNRESDIRQLKLPLPVFGDPTRLSQHLPLVSSCYDKLSWENKPKSELEEINSNIATATTSKSQTSVDE